MEEVVAPCDACQKEDANLRCSNCHCYYYCSKSCQLEHWKKEHRKECKALAKHMIDFNTADKKMDVFIDKNKEASSQDCSVCFEQIDINQLQLPCHHVFCLECMVKVNCEVNALQCPLCRSETDGLVHQYLLSNIVMFIGRARRSPFKRAQYCHLARLEYEKLKTIEGHYSKSISSQMAVKVTVADLYFVEGNYSTAEMCALEAVQSNTLTGSGLTEALMIIANSRMESENYTGAVESYKNIYTVVGDDFEHNTSAMRNFYHNLSRCFYHIGDYEMSLQMGGVAVTMNRH
jgi:tetratricopeptide (TPR) repeat protein